MRIKWRCGVWLLSRALSETPTVSSEMEILGKRWSQISVETAAVILQLIWLHAIDAAKRIIFSIRFLRFAFCHCTIDARTCMKDFCREGGALSVFNYQCQKGFSSFMCNARTCFPITIWIQRLFKWLLFPRNQTGWNLVSAPMQTHSTSRHSQTNTRISLEFKASIIRFDIRREHGCAVWPESISESELADGTQDGMLVYAD